MNGYTMVMMVIGKIGDAWLYDVYRLEIRRRSTYARGITY